MDRKVDKPYILHIHDAIELIESWTSGKSLDDFSPIKNFRAPLSDRLKLSEKQPEKSVRN